MPDTINVVPKNATAVLMLADGQFFFGTGIGIEGSTYGEICFNTGLTGYQETLTDPSYAGQIITFTFPHIGNVGTNEEDQEAKKVAARGLVIREPITTPSNFRSQNHLQEWLVKQNLTGICRLDTRMLTRLIREQGPQNVAIYFFGKKENYDPEPIKKALAKHPSLKGMELAKEVTTKETYNWDQTKWQLGKGHGKQGNHKYKIVAIDYGAKHNILRCLSSLEAEVIVVPADTKAEEILNHQPDGIFLSNGPGDPAATGKYALPILKKLIDSNVPIFGICLGHQLLALAFGCKTEKMHQGHRGSNQPVQDLSTSKVEITSQNHGFVVVKENIPEDVEITHLSLFDGTVEGIKSKTKPIFSVQHHPEASPGPHDSQYLFHRFLDLIKEHKNA